MDDTPLDLYTLDLDLTQAILARTSGSPCRRLEAIACDWVDGQLEPGQVSLAQGHLDHCPACRALLASLEELQTLLPALALLQPPAAFTAEVLRATLPTEPPSFSDTCLRLLCRPRICLEAAYLGTVAGMLTLSLPLPTQRAVADATLVSHLLPLQRVLPALQTTRARAQACERAATLGVARQARQAKTFWAHLLSSLRAWSLRWSNSAWVQTLRRTFF